MKIINFNCSIDDLHIIARIGWLTCNQYLNMFYHYDKKYNEFYLAQCEAEITYAEKLYNNLEYIIKNRDTEEEIEAVNTKIYERLDELFNDAQKIFMFDTQVQKQLVFDNILFIVLHLA